MKETFVLSIFLFSQLFISGKAYAQEEPSILVGVEYFSGWWEPSPNKWERGGKDWRTQYPERIPLLGEYNSQETMDKEIDVAATHGIDFFSILWYYPGHVKHNSRTDRCEFLNAGLKHFMNSPNSGRMKFMVELCNHAPFSIISDTDWDRCMAVCVEAMKHPSYLRIDGKAVLKIHGAHQFYLDNGSSIDRSRQVLKRLRQKGLDSGVGELLIMVGAYGVNPITDKDVFVRMGEVDGTMQYMDATGLPQKETDYPYEDLAGRADQVRHIREKDAIPYVPYFPDGWNPKPWREPRE